MPKRDLAGPKPCETAMNTLPVRLVRVYLKESKLDKDIVRHLKEVFHIRGVSLFRAVSGYGTEGEASAALIDLSFHLPIVIEFFDVIEKVEPAVEYLNQTVKPEHLVFWDALSNI